MKLAMIVLVAMLVLPSVVSASGNGDVLFYITAAEKNTDAKGVAVEGPMTQARCAARAAALNSFKGLSFVYTCESMSSLQDRK